MALNTLWMCSTRDQIPQQSWKQFIVSLYPLTRILCHYGLLHKARTSALPYCSSQCCSLGQKSFFVCTTCLELTLLTSISSQWEREKWVWYISTANLFQKWQMLSCKKVGREWEKQFQEGFELSKRTLPPWINFISGNTKVEILP